MKRKNGMYNVKKSGFMRVFALLAAVLARVGSLSGVCPVCTAAAGAGVGIAHRLGVDNTITGLWVGGLLLSVSLWTIAFLDRHNIKFFCKRLIVPVGYYALTILSLRHAGWFAPAYGKMLGISKLLFGIILGTILFMAGTCWSNYLKRENFGQVRFSYQKIIIPMALLSLFSLILYCITK